MGQMHFAVNLDPPLKQGQTRYHFLVFNFKMEDEEDIELPFTDEEVQEKFEGKLEREMSGPTHDLLSKIIKAVVQKENHKARYIQATCRARICDLFSQGSFWFHL